MQWRRSGRTYMQADRLEEHKLMLFHAALAGSNHMDVPKDPQPLHVVHLTAEMAPIAKASCRSRVWPDKT